MNMKPCSRGNDECPADCCTGKPDLKAEWLKLYSEVLTPDEHDEDFFAEEDFRSLCVGWALAKGLSAPEAFAFYNEMISAGAF